MPDSALGDKGGISRRQVLARGAVAAGIVWAAPVIRTTSAYAAASDGTERPATRFFCVAIDASNHVWSVFPGGGADLPGGWQPESVGNGWPQPWDGTGEPPWAQTSTRAARGRVYTYRPDNALVAGPGRSVAFARSRADDLSGTGGTGTDDLSGTGSTGTSTDPPVDDPPIDVTSDLGSSVDGTPVDDATVAADDPEMPDADQFSRRIGADLPDPLPPPIVDWVYANPGIELEAPDRRPALTQVGDAAWACVLPAPPALPDWWSRRYRLVLGCYKDGNYFGEDGYEDPDPPSSELGRRLLFPTRIERVGGYAGRSGQPGRAGPDVIGSGDTTSSRVGGPGSSVRFDDEPATPTRPREPDQPDLPDLPGSSSSTTTTSTTSTTVPGTTPAWDPTKCVPDPKAAFPWNLPWPTNFLVAWVGPRYGLKIPKPPASACLPPSDPEDPSTASSTTTTTTRPPKRRDHDADSGSGDHAERDAAGDSSSTTTTTTTTAPPAAAAAPAAPQAPTDEIRHQPTPRKKRVKYSHTGHLGDHECIVLIYCRP